jgi:hypothetical protein
MKLLVELDRPAEFGAIAKVQYLLEIIEERS